MFVLPDHLLAVLRRLVAENPPPGFFRAPFRKGLPRCINELTPSSPGTRRPP